MTPGPRFADRFTLIAKTSSSAISVGNTHGSHVSHVRMKQTLTSMSPKQGCIENAAAGMRMLVHHSPTNNNLLSSTICIGGKSFPYNTHYQIVQCAAYKSDGCLLLLCAVCIVAFDPRMYVGLRPRLCSAKLKMILMDFLKCMNKRATLRLSAHTHT